MTHHYATPGVYIEEITSPGVIAGVGTSTAAFIGPALHGPVNEARRITSFDDFQTIYGGVRDNRPWPYLFVGDTPLYLAFAVSGFFTNGGWEAYIVRVGTGGQAWLDIQNGAPEPVFRVRALEEGLGGEHIQVEIQRYADQEIARGSATVILVNPAQPTEVQVDHPESFQVGDTVVGLVGGALSPQRTVNDIRGDRLILNQDIPNLGSAPGDTVRIADLAPAQASLRPVSLAGLYRGGMALIQGDNAAVAGVNIETERVQIDQVNANTGFITLAAAPARNTTYNLDAAVPAPTLTSVRVISRGEATVAAVQGPTVTVNPSEAAQFRPGDFVQLGANRARIVRIQGDNLILDQVLAPNPQVRIADIIPGQLTFRVADATGLFPGTVVQIWTHPYALANQMEYAVIQSVDGAGFVRLDPIPTLNQTYPMGVPAGQEPVLVPQEFRLVVRPPAAAAVERHENLSANPQHPRYILTPRLLSSEWISIESPAQPPITEAYPNRLVALTAATPLAGSAEDHPLGLTAAHYQDGLDVLRHVDNVNLVCIPDAAAHPDWQNIQGAMINHCLEMSDRFAILDSLPGAPLTGPGSIEEQRQAVQAERGFAALYYPWLMVPDPQSTGPLPRLLFCPPCGHLAGVYARTDAERGVHKAPANTEVRGVMGLERRLSDRQQGPLNLLGINVLRLFPGSRQVTVWGARTTVDPNITDWVYLNVRRLMLYIEESIEEGIRWAVFEPNNQQLWKKLKRSITEFLSRVWRDGALFGKTPDQAFYVRIDEALNPDTVRALGRLYIEIGVRPSYPAEFIIVRIGLWDGGAQISEM